MKGDSNEAQQIGVPEEWESDAGSRKQDSSENGVLLPPSKRARKEKYANYVPEEETIRNDYSQRYVDGGEWPQNWVLGARLEQRFEEYPKQRRLLELKRAAVSAHAHAPTYLQSNDLASLVESQTKFDVILLDPPVSEGTDSNKDFTWNDVQAMPIPALAAEPSFIFMWVGSGAGDGLERGREVLARWGFRRCEDVVWVKTNNNDIRGPGGDPPTTSLFTRTKQHCLMGIKGTVRRSTDNWFVHCNIDPTRKPPEMYSLIENFCLGTRRLEIFGKLSSLRRGWVTALAANAGTPLNPKELNSASNDMDTNLAPVQWDKATWEADLHRENGKYVVPSSQEIEILRPKSPQRGPPNNTNISNVKTPFPPSMHTPSPHPPNPNNMLGKPLHMGFQRPPSMPNQPGGMGPGMGMPMGMPMGVGMRMGEFGFGGVPNMMLGPQSMNVNGMMPNPNGMMGNSMFGMGGGMLVGVGMPGQQMMFNQNFAPGHGAGAAFDAGGSMGGNMGGNMAFEMGGGPGHGGQPWWDGNQRGAFQGGNQRSGQEGMMQQPMGVFMNNMMGNVQLPPGFDGGMNRGF